MKRKNDGEERFSVYKHHFIIEGNRLVSRQFIVLHHADGTLQFTDFHRYIGSPRHRIKRYTDDGNSRFQFITPLLNYAFFHVGIRRLDDLTADIVSEYLNSYGMCTLPWDVDNTARSEETVKRCVQSVMDFMEQFINARGRRCRLRKDDLYKYVNRRDKRGKAIKVKVPAFDVHFIDHKKEIFRDIPNDAFDLLFNHIAREHKELLGLISLSAFAGLRPGEACSTRRVDSPLGPGLLFEEVGGRLTRAEIDLREELILRSDMIPTGWIKKERKQRVPDIFLSAFRDAYDLYMSYLNGREFEAAFAPFSLNSQGKAITYASYRGKFHDIIKDEMIPIYLSSDDPEVVMYGRILMEHNLAPHVFRHWYTVQLVLAGVDDVASLMYWRGDRSPQSALTYLQNKGELAKKYRKVNNEVFNYLFWASEKHHD